MTHADQRALITAAMGIAAGWWLGGHWGAGAAALLFCAARLWAQARGGK